jgi:surface antigen
VTKNLFLLFKKSSKKVAVGVCAAAILVAGPIQFTQTAYADRYDDQIRAIQQQMAPLQQKANELNGKANTIQAAVDAFTAEKNAIQAQIDLSQAKYDKLTHDIEVNKQKLAKSQDALATTVADLYVDDSISPLEMLASSKNVSDYMDKQEFRTAVSERLDEVIASIKKLKAQLEADQKAVERVLADQKIQREAKAAKEAEQQKLLDETRGEEAIYQQLTAQKKGQIDSLRSQQAAEIRARASSSGYRALPGDPNRGGYPGAWMNASMSSCSADPWGMCKRQCVSYAAFKVDSTYGNMPNWGGYGNANQWANNARAVGIPTSPEPKAGTVGVQYSGAYGHVAWVESVNGDGTLTISQFNANWSGEYSRWIVDRSFFNEYVYFGG